MNDLSKNQFMAHDRGTVRRPGECKAKCLVNEHNSRTGHNLDPKTANSGSKSGIISVNKGVK